MKRYRVCGTVTGSKYLGEFTANSPEEAIEKALDENSHVSLCHQCSSECEDPEVLDANAEEIQDEPKAEKKRKAKP